MTAMLIKQFIALNVFGFIGAIIVLTLKNIFTRLLK
jgi:hypothetical protein